MKEIKIQFRNGLKFDPDCNNILSGLLNHYEFIDSDNPEFIIFGPYGNDIPEKSNRYTRIGYFCENIIPDLSICEWAFGVPRESFINDEKYYRIQWHGLDPAALIKTLSDNDIDRLTDVKRKFCNFIYSNQVPYREQFFNQLSKYKRIDAPGKSMNNMESVDKYYTGNRWERKRKFLSEYKFTIAFENYSFPGYQTEKLYDPMLANSIPIYCGDPFIGDIFNKESFLNVPDYVPVNNSKALKFLEKMSEQDFKDYRPQFYHSPYYKIRRKLKTLGREVKMNIQFNNLDFSNLIERIIELDKDPELFKKYLLAPWLNNNIDPANGNTQLHWKRIFC